jgi:hypothetical protein
MRVSDLIDQLTSCKDLYGDMDVVLNINAGEDSLENNVSVQKSENIRTTYFQVSVTQEILIIGD